MAPRFHRLAQRVLPDDILVLGLVKQEMADVTVRLQRSGMEARLLGDAGPRSSVRVSTIHGAKGLDADRVIVLDAHRLDSGSRRRDDGSSTSR